MSPVEPPKKSKQLIKLNLKSGQHRVLLPEELTRKQRLLEFVKRKIAERQAKIKALEEQRRQHELELERQRQDLRLQKTKPKEYSNKPISVKRLRAIDFNGKPITVIYDDLQTHNKVNEEYQTDDKVWWKVIS